MKNEKLFNLMTRFIILNKEVVSLRDDQIASVFLCEDSIQYQRAYTQGLIDALTMCLDLDDTSELEDSIKGLKYLLKRKHLSFTEALDREVKGGKG